MDAAAPTTRNLATTRAEAGALASVFLRGDDAPVLPWDALKELLRSLAAELQDWAATLEARARAAALPVAALAALVAIVFCCCCCGYCAAGGGRRRRRGPDGEESCGRDGPVVRYGGRGRGGYKGGIFSLHPNKPIVCCPVSSRAYENVPKL